MWASVEARLAGVIAYAPDCVLDEGLASWMRSWPVPDVANLEAITRYSMPMKLADKLTCPVLLVHSRSDRAVTRSARLRESDWR
ncbi:MAG: hypothetical protein AAF958_19860 [Planctomycetota bacterium]